MANTLEELKEILKTDINTITDTSFDVNITSSTSVPTVEDSGITYPNLDEKKINAKTITTCVLYIDIRKSTELNLKHTPKTLTKLYSAFMRSMIKAAQHYNGKVRNIIGDRIMVVFEEENCFNNAVHTAILLNSVSKYLLNPAFSYNDISCGIGIDYGEMLVSKGGIKKNGKENAPYKSLVWLGSPANIASKLTDLANKDITIDKSNVFYIVDSTSIEKKCYYLSFKEFFSNDYIKKYNLEYMEHDQYDLDLGWFHSNKFSAFPWSLTDPKKVKTPEILMTESVFFNYKRENINNNEIKNNLWKKQDSSLYEGYNIYGGGLIYPVFKP
ncbi:MAG: adenylate/guanylate cyclase domain-containing protein [Carnobacterium sp.]|uniref:adenylate/guanylate cyclase domain-containing protein n=1 Tax=Carnobacterium sp. TaxID=48221 RepID=UPI003314972C